MIDAAERDVAQGAGEHLHGGGAGGGRAQRGLGDVLGAAGLLAAAGRGGDHLDALPEAPRGAGVAARALPERGDAVRLGAGRDGRRVPRGLQRSDAADRGGHDRSVRRGRVKRAG